MEALKVVRLLAEGVNPLTGEVLPDETVYNSPLVIRSLFAVIEAAQTTPAKSARAKPDNQGKPWTEDDKALIATAHAAGADIKTLAQQFARTVGGIEAELLRQGLIERQYPPSHPVDLAQVRPI